MSNQTNSTETAPSPLVILKSDKYIDLVNDAGFDSVLVPSFVYTVIMLIIGCPGNAIVFYVYFSRWNRTTSRVFILALAVFDIVNNFFTSPTELIFMWNWFRWTNGTLCKFSRFLTFMMNNCSSFTLLGIAVDRYTRICRPLKPAMSTKKAKIIVFAGCIFAVIFAWPALFVYGIQSTIYPIKPGVYVQGSMCLIENHFTKTDYPLAFTSVLLAGNILIDIALITLYSAIVIQVLKRGSFDRDSTIKQKLRKASVSTTTTDDGQLAITNSGSKSPSLLTRFASRLQSVSKNSTDNSDGSPKSPSKNDSRSASMRRSNFRKQRSMSIQSEEARRVRMIKTTIMLFMVTVLFIVSFVPYCVIVIIRYLNPMYYVTLSSSGKAVYQLVLRSYLLSMSLNPLIYSFMSEKFRTECKACFKKITKCKS